MKYWIKIHLCASIRTLIYNSRLKVTFTEKGKSSSCFILINPSVPRPAKEVKGFEKIWLKNGEQKIVTIHLDEVLFHFMIVKHMTGK